MKALNVPTDRYFMIDLLFFLNDKITHALTHCRNRSRIMLSMEVLIRVHGDMYQLGRELEDRQKRSVTFEKMEILG